MHLHSSKLLVLSAFVVICFIHYAAAQVDPSVPARYTTVDESLTFSETASIIIADVEFLSGVLSIDLGSGIAPTTSRIEIQISSSRFGYGTGVRIHCDSASLPLSVTEIVITVSQTKFYDAFFAISGAFSKASIEISHVVFTATWTIAWPSDLQTQLTAFGVTSPLVAFISTTFAPHSSVYFINVILNNKNPSTTCTALSFVGETMLHRTYVTMQGAAVSADCTNGAAITFPTAALSLSLNESSVLHLQDISLSSKTPRGIIFGDVIVDAQSVLEIERVYSHASSGMMETLVDISQLFLLAQSELFVVGCRTNAAGVQVLRAGNITTSTNSRVVLLKNYAVGSTAFEVTHVYEKSSGSQLVAQCNYVSDGNTLIADADYVAAMQQTPDTHLLDCSTCSALTRCSAVTDATSGTSSPDAYSCFCTCGTAGFGPRCLPNEFFYNRAASGPLHFTFDSALSFNAATLELAPAFSGWSSTSLTLQGESFLRLDICLFSLMADPLYPSSFNSAASLMFYLHGALLTSNSEILFVSCGATLANSDPFSTTNVHPVEVTIHNTQFYDSALYFQGQFPAGSRVDLQTLTWHFGSGGLAKTCGVPGGVSRRAGVQMCAVKIQAQSTFRFETLDVNGDDGGSTDALIYIGGGLHVQSYSQLTISNVNFNGHIVTRFVLAESLGLSSLEIADGSVVVFSNLLLNYVNGVDTIKINSDVILSSQSVFVLERVDSTVTSTPLLRLQGGNLSILDSSWFLLRELKNLYSTYPLYVDGTLTISDYSVLTFAYSGTSSSTMGLYAADTSIDGTSVYDIKCTSSSSQQVFNPVFGVTPTGVHLCGTCLSRFSCFLPMTTGVDGGCNCVCGSAGYGPQCLPILLDDVDAVMVDVEAGAPPPPPSGGGSSASGPNPPGALPSPGDIVSTNLEIPLVFSTYLERITVTYPAVITVLLDVQVPPEGVTFQCLQCHLENGATVVFSGSTMESGSVATGGPITILFDQLSVSASTIAFFGHMPSASEFTVRFTNTIVSGGNAGTDVPLWAMSASLGPLDYSPHFAFVDVTLYSGSSVVFENTMVALADAVSLIVFVGAAVFINASFALQSFAVSSSGAQSAVLTACHESGSGSRVERTALLLPLSVPQINGSVGLYLLNGSEFVVADGTVSGNASPVTVGLLVASQNSAFAVHRLLAKDISTSAVRFMSGHHVEVASWLSIRSVQTSGSLVLIGSPHYVVDSTSSISVVKNVVAGALLFEVTELATAVSGSIALRCNKVNAATDAAELEAQLNIISPFGGTLHLSTCSECGTRATECAASDDAAVFANCGCQCAAGVGPHCMPHALTAQSTHHFVFVWNNPTTSSTLWFHLPNSIELAVPFQHLALTSVAFYSSSVRIGYCDALALLDGTQASLAAAALSVHFQRVQFYDTSVEFSSCRTGSTTTVHNSLSWMRRGIVAAWDVLLEDVLLSHATVAFHGDLPSQSKVLIDRLQVYSEVSSPTNVACGSGYLNSFVALCGVRLQDLAVFAIRRPSSYTVAVDAFVAIGGGFVASNRSQLVITEAGASYNAGNSVVLLVTADFVSAPSEPVVFIDGSVLVVSDIGAEGAEDASVLRIDASLLIARGSAVIFSDLNYGQWTGSQTPTLMFSSTVELADVSWLLFRRVHPASARIAQFNGFLNVTSNSRLTVADCNAYDAEPPEVFLNQSSSFDDTSDAVTKCNRASNRTTVPLHIEPADGITVPPVEGPCDVCSVSVSCYEPLTESVDRRGCTCECSTPDAYGPLCLPANVAFHAVGPDDGVTLSKSIELIEDPPVPNPKSVVTNSLLYRVTPTLLFYDVTFKNGAVLAIQLGSSMPDDVNITVQLVGCTFLSGAALHIHVAPSPLPVGLTVTIIITQLGAIQSPISLSGHFPPSSVVRLSNSMFSSSSLLNWGDLSDALPRDAVSPLLAFFSLALDSGSLLVLENIVATIASAKSASSGIVFIGHITVAEHSALVLSRLVLNVDSEALISSPLVLASRGSLVVRNESVVIIRDISISSKTPRGLDFLGSVTISTYSALVVERVEFATLTGLGVVFSEALTITAAALMILECTSGASNASMILQGLEGVSALDGSRVILSRNSATNYAGDMFYVWSGQMLLSSSTVTVECNSVDDGSGFAVLQADDYLSQLGVAPLLVNCSLCATESYCVAFGGASSAIEDQATGTCRCVCDSVDDFGEHCLPTPMVLAVANSTPFEFSRNDFVLELATIEVGHAFSSISMSNIEFSQFSTLRIESCSRKAQPFLGPPTGKTVVALTSLVFSSLSELAMVSCVSDAVVDGEYHPADASLPVVVLNSDADRAQPVDAVFQELVFKDSTVYVEGSFPPQSRIIIKNTFWFFAQGGRLRGCGDVVPGAKSERAAFVLCEVVLNDRSSLVITGVNLITGTVDILLYSGASLVAFTQSQFIVNSIYMNGFTANRLLFFDLLSANDSVIISDRSAMVWSNFALNNVVGSAGGMIQCSAHIFVSDFSTFAVDNLKEMVSDSTVLRFSNLVVVNNYSWWLLRRIEMTGTSLVTLLSDVYITHHSTLTAAYVSTTKPEGIGITSDGSVIRDNTSAYFAKCLRILPLSSVNAPLLGGVLPNMELQGCDICTLESGCFPPYSIGLDVDMCHCVCAPEASSSLICLPLPLWMQQVLPLDPLAQPITDPPAPTPPPTMAEPPVPGSVVSTSMTLLLHSNISLERITVVYPGVLTVLLDVSIANDSTSFACVQCRLEDGAVLQFVGSMNGVFSGSRHVSVRLDQISIDASALLFVGHMPLAGFSLVVSNSILSGYFGKGNPLAAWVAAGYDGLLEPNAETAPLVGFVSLALYPGSSVLIENTIVSLATSTTAIAFVGRTVVIASSIAVNGVSAVSSATVLAPPSALLTVSYGSGVAPSPVSMNTSLLPLEFSGIIMGSSNSFVALIDGSTWRMSGIVVTGTTQVFLFGCVLSSTSVFLLERVVARGSNFPVVQLNDGIVLQNRSWLSLRLMRSTEALMSIASSGPYVIDATSGASFAKNEVAGDTLFDITRNLSAVVGHVSSRCSVFNWYMLPDDDTLEEQLRVNRTALASFSNEACNTCGSRRADCSAADVGASFSSCKCVCSSGTGPQCTPVSDARHTKKDFVFLRDGPGTSIITVRLSGTLEFANAFQQVTLKQIAFVGFTVQVSFCDASSLADSLLDTQRPQLVPLRLFFTGVEVHNGLLMISSCNSGNIATLSNGLSWMRGGIVAPWDVELRDVSLVNSFVLLYGDLPSGSRVVVDGLTLTPASLSPAWCGSSAVYGFIVACGVRLQDASTLAVRRVASSDVIASNVVIFAGGFIVTNRSQFVFTECAAGFVVAGGGFALVFFKSDPSYPDIPVVVSQKSALVVSQCDVSGIVSDISPVVFSTSLVLHNESVLLLSDLRLLMSYPPAGSPAALVLFLGETTEITERSWALFRRLNTPYRRVSTVLGKLLVANRSRITVADCRTFDAAGAQLSFHLNDTIDFDNTSRMNSKCNSDINGTVDSLLVDAFDFLELHESECDQCDVQTSCFETLTASVDRRRCRCECLSNDAHGVLCLPVDVAFGVTAVLPDDGVTMTPTYQLVYILEVTDEAITDPNFTVPVGVAHIIFRNVTFANDHVISFNLTELTLQDAPRLETSSSAAYGFRVEFHNCTLHSSVLHFIGFPVDDYLSQFSVLRAASTTPETIENVTGPTTADVLENAAVWPYRFQLLVDGFVMHSGTSLLFEGVLPLNSNITMNHVFCDDHAPPAADIDLPLNPSSAFPSGASLFFYRFCLMGSDVVLSDAVFVPLLSSNASASVPPIAFDNDLYLGFSTFVLHRVMFVAVEDASPVQIAYTSSAVIEYGSALAFVDCQLQGSPGVDVLTPLLKCMHTPGSWGPVLVRYYSTLVFHATRSSSSLIGVTTYLILDGYSQIRIESTVAAGGLVVGALDIGATSTAVVSDTNSSMFFSHASVFAQKENSMASRCLFTLNGTDATPLNSYQDLLSVGFARVSRDVVPCASEESGTSDPNLSPTACDLELDCFPPATVALSSATCSCICSPSLHAHKDSTGDSQCFLRSISFYRGSRTAMLLRTQEGYPSRHVSTCDARDSMPLVTEVSGGSPAMNGSWMWRARFQRPVTAVEGIYTHALPCHLAASSERYGDAIRPLQQFSSIPLDIALAPDNWQWNVLRCSVPSVVSFYNPISGLLQLPPGYNSSNQPPPITVPLAFFLPYPSLDQDLVDGLYGAAVHYTLVVPATAVVGMPLFVFPPTVTSVSGCLGDIFPGTFRCPQDGSMPLTIYGENFAVGSIINISIEFYVDSKNIPVNKAPELPMMLNAKVFANDLVLYPTHNFSSRYAVVPCGNWTHVNTTTLICENYPGLGEGGIIALHSTAYGSYRFPLATVSYIPDLSALCPVSAVFGGAVCGGHGACSTDRGTCACVQSAAGGFWDGDACDRCAAAFNASESAACLQRCPVDDFGNVCGGAGECGGGQCRCGDTWTTGVCNASCPGLNAPCSGHGTCDTSSGTCACAAGADSGYWAGAGCSDCAPGYSGVDCATACPAGADGAACSGRGACWRGVCFCEAGRCGADCSIATDGLASEAAALLCGACPFPSQFGAGCAFTCPGSTNPQDACSGHGACDGGVLGSGYCRCAAGYAGAACSVQCPVGADGALCAGHGRCDAVTAQCECERGFGGVACAAQCASAGGLLCGGHGACDEGSGGTGRCVCDAGYSGEACATTCLGRFPACSGHGACRADGACDCFASAATGHWGAPSCDACAAGWVGSSCNLQCAAGPNGLPCSGRGFCNDQLRCQCLRSAAGGFWDGAVCERCADGYAGAACAVPCDGGACTPCNLHGTCHAANGSCACFDDDVRGHWSAASACGACRRGYYGALCERACPFCARGVCLDGVEGNGTCACDDGFARNESGACAACERGRYGPGCAACPSCSGHGACVDGITGSGACVCDAGYASVNCSIACNISRVDGALCGNGTCVAQGVCRCRANFTLDADLTCSACVAGNYGAACNLTCPACARGFCARNGTCVCPRGYWGALCQFVCPGGAAAPCGLRGACSVADGTCACHASSALGFFVGAACEACDPRYASATCAVACPVDAAIGAVCSGRGTCWNGRCDGCGPLRNETTTVFAVCGAACNATNADCLQFAGACPAARWGPPECAGVCPGTVGAVACGGHGICSPDNGTCFCLPGYYGAACATSCASGFSRALNQTLPCAGNGRCLPSGQCACVAGYWGGACHLECPGGADAPCSNRGECEVDGTCTCAYGALGGACERECPGGFAAPCARNGVCAASGSCSCFASASSGYWAGANCTLCASGFGGASCATPCPAGRGVVVNNVCVCRDGYVGADCSLVCPVAGDDEPGSGLVCGGHGACIAEFNKTSNTTAVFCECLAGWFGGRCVVSCSIASCRAKFQMVRPQCNRDTGACECEQAPGVWEGSRCERCAATHWGAECNQVCQCSGHGVCSTDSGECSCFGDADNGFWRGSLCAVCQDGYVGSQCRIANIALATQSQPAAVGTISGDTDVFLAASSWCSLPDLTSGLLWTASGTSTVSAVDLFSNTLAATVDVGGNAIECSIHDDDFLAVSVQSATDATVVVLFIHRQTYQIASGNLHALRHRLQSLNTPLQDSHRFQTLSDTLLRQVSQNGYLCKLYGNITTMYIVSATCALPSNTTVTTTLPSPIAVRWAGIVLLDRADDLLSRFHLLLTASDGSGGVVLWNLARNRTTAYVVRAPVTATPVALQQCSVRVQDVEAVYCVGLTPSVDDQAQNDVVVAAFMASTHALRTVTRVDTRLPASAALTAFFVDPLFNLALAAYNAPGAASTVLTIRVASWNSTTASEEVTVIGTQELPLQQVALSLAVEPGARTLLIVALRLTALSVLRYNLFGVLAAAPAVVDASGGAVLRISGEGFPVNASVPVQCVTGGIVSTAVVLDQSTVTCVVGRSRTGGGSCDFDTVNVVLGNASTDTRTVTILRPVPVILGAAVTDAGSAGFGPAARAVTVTLTGLGFVPSAGAACRLVNRSTRAEVFRAPALVRSSTVATCVQPAAPPSAVATCVEYSHDGFFFGASCVTYQIVGEFGALRQASRAAGSGLLDLPRPGDDELVIRAAALTAVPAFRILTLDIFGNPRGPFETTTALYVRCSTLEATVAITNRVSELLVFASNTSLVLAVADGVADFSSLLLVAPSVGFYPFYCFATVDSTITALLALRIVPGLPSQSRVVAHGSWYVGVTKRNVLLPNPELVLLDTAGNVIRTNAGIPASAVLQREVYDPRGMVFSLQSDISIPRADGTYVFENVATQTVFARDTPMSFFVNGVPPFVLTIRQETCASKSEYGRKGTSACSPCPENGICDGSFFVRVQAGYWRASVEAYRFYSCTPADACPTDRPCGVGYEGVMCRECAASYGWSVNYCAACLSSATNRALIVLVVLCFAAIVYYLSVGAMPLTSVADYMYISASAQKNPASVVAKLAVSHLQMVAIVPFARIDLPGWFRQFFLVAQSGSSINPNLSFISCEIGSGLRNNLLAAIIVCPLMVVMFVLLCFAAAKWTARSFSRAAYHTLVVRAGLTNVKNLDKVAEYVAKGDREHEYEVEKSHLQFFTGAAGETEEEETQDATSSNRSFTKIDSALDADDNSGDLPLTASTTATYEDALHTLQSEKEKVNQSSRVLWSRWLNMLCVATTVVFFVMFPTIMGLAASLLDCTTLDYGNGVETLVVATEPSVSCAGEGYARLTKIAWAILISVGVGVPMMSVVFVKLLTHVTCGGRQAVAQEIFFFATGGYSPKMWFWESVSLFRKVLLVLGSTLLSEIELRVLWCVWILMASVWMNITLRPWQSHVLSNVELCSLAALTFTFGGVELLLLLTGGSYTATRNATVAAIIAVNILVLGVFAGAVMWFLKDKGIEMAERDNSFLRRFLDNSKRNVIRRRRQEIREYLVTLRDLHPRFCALSELELLAQKLIEEYKEEQTIRMAAIAGGIVHDAAGNDLDDPNVNSSSNISKTFTKDDAVAVSICPRILQGSVYREPGPRKRMDATPKVAQRYIHDGQREAIAIKLATSTAPSTAATNPLDHIHVTNLDNDDDDVFHHQTNGAGATNGSSMFCRAVGELLHQSATTAVQSHAAIRTGSASSNGSHPKEKAPTVLQRRAAAKEHNPFSRFDAAFADMWEIWAYWTSLATSMTHDSETDAVLEELVDRRMEELFEIELRLMQAALHLATSATQQ